MKPAINIQNVSKTFSIQGANPFSSLKGAKKVALDDVTLSIPHGEIFGFLGPNGAGKTTLIKTIVGLLKPDSGLCEVSTKLGAIFPTHAIEAKKCFGYLPERPYYHEFLTSEEFLIFHGTLLGLTKSEISDKIPSLLKRVGLNMARDQKLKTFSKGMLQRIGFAQALINDPDILILDEPMSGLDPIGRREVRDIILEVASSGKTIFFSTHIIHDVEIICSNVAYIQGGKLKGSGSIDKLLGKTVKSLEVRFSLPGSANPATHPLLHDHMKKAKKTMDGWVVEIEGDENELESEMQIILKNLIEAKGVVRSLVPRKSTLEDLFFKDSKSQ